MQASVRIIERHHHCGDFDGDGKADPGVFRPTSTNWYINRSTAGILINQFGQTGDLPVPNAFVR